MELYPVRYCAVEQHNSYAFAQTGEPFSEHAKTGSDLNI
jgi:hypothetical protein